MNLLMANLSMGVACLSLIEREKNVPLARISPSSSNTAAFGYPGREANRQHTIEPPVIRYGGQRKRMADCWLLLETSGRSCHLGLAPGDAIVASQRLDEPRRLARDLANVVRSMLHEQRLQPRELAGVIVSIGPGSYTGLRVGIASAKAFAYAAGCPLIAVPTFAAIALQSAGRGVGTLGDRRRIAGHGLLATVCLHRQECLCHQ